MTISEIHPGRHRRAPIEGSWTDNAVPTAGGRRSVLGNDGFLQLGFLERQDVRNQALSVGVFRLRVDGSSVSYLYEPSVEQNAESMADELDYVDVVGYEKV